MDWGWDDEVFHRIDGDPRFCPCRHCKAHRARLEAEHELASRTVVKSSFRSAPTTVILPPPPPAKPWWKLW